MIFRWIAPRFQHGLAQEEIQRVADGFAHFYCWRPVQQAMLAMLGFGGHVLVTVAVERLAFDIAETGERREVIAQRAG
jgi:hypothetical protein